MSDLPNYYKQSFLSLTLLPSSEDRFLVVEFPLLSKDFALVCSFVSAVTSLGMSPGVRCNRMLRVSVHVKGQDSDDKLGQQCSDDKLAQQCSDDKLAQQCSDDKLAQQCSDDKLAQQCSDDKLAQKGSDDKLAQKGSDNNWVRHPQKALIQHIYSYWLDILFCLPC